MSRRVYRVRVVAYDKSVHGDVGECLICNRAPRRGVVATVAGFDLFYCERCVDLLGAALRTVDATATAPANRHTIHPSHVMIKPFTEARSPAGTPRFYEVRRCRGCEHETIAHPAGRFTDDELLVRCTTPAKRRKKG